MELVPARTKLSEIYSNIDPQVARYKNILTKFAHLYGGPKSQRPDIIVRSPGRVNVIGDHIDYSYYSVLPMAIENDVVMAISFDVHPPSRTDSCSDIETMPAKVRIANMDPKFEAQEFTIPNDGSQIEIDAAKSDWVNYFRCGLAVVHDHLPKSKFVDMNVLVDGNVPDGAGLSSSAAFVVCATFAALYAQGETEIDKKTLTKLSTKCEQFVGVNSGGMDQSASIFGEKLNALLVSFVPDLNVTKFTFPETDPKIAFVVANSLVAANKHETGPVNYNLRVVEVTLAANMMAAQLGFKLANDGNLQAGTLRGVMEQYFGDKKKFGEKNLAQSREMLEEMAQLVEKLLPKKDGYTTEEVATMLKCTPEQLKEKYMTTYPVRYEKLQLHDRALHVYQESKRVLDFLAVLENPPKDTKQMFTELGALIDQCHTSAKCLYKNSCPELDELCDIARKNGSYGSRVTGAGFGGCSVHLVPADKTQQLMDALTEQYYKKRFPEITAAKLSDAMIVTEPGSGTCLVKEQLSLD